MGKMILVLGGARSGKSTFAQQMAQERGGDRVVYVATAEVKDYEMQRRVKMHRQSRPEKWHTLELQRDVGATIVTEARHARAILVDCLTQLVSNLIVDARDPFAKKIEAQVNLELEALTACAEALPGDLIIVSNEVGLGLVPTAPMGRAFRDLVGRANQVLAQKADKVYFLVAGIPMVLKGA